MNSTKLTAGAVMKPVGVIKRYPEDFLVQELVYGKGSVFAVPIEQRNKPIKYKEGQPVTVLNLTKVGFTTQAAVAEIARQCGVRNSAISYHGLKDCHAITAQRIGIQGPFTPRFSHKKISVQNAGCKRQPLSIGGNAGNRFNIHVITEVQAVNPAAMESFPNLFGNQRIGSKESNRVGQFLFEGRFESAAELFFEHAAYANQVKLNNAYKEKKDWKKAWLDPSFSFELGFQLQKWQSQLWNELVKQLIGGQITAKLPMWSPQHQSIYKGLWNPPQLDQDILKRMRTFDRQTLAKASNLQIKRTSNGWRFMFDLESGQYATTALSELFALKE